MKLIYTTEIIVTQEHLDRNNHVNNVQYVHWVEEAAAAHWNILKHQTDYVNDYWVLVDHHIQYKKQVFLHDKLIVKTYPENPEGIKQPRKVEFYCDDTLVVDSRTLWILMDHQTSKIKRLAPNWLEELSK
jgi:acyl-CoA thioester hydrolase